MDKAFDVITVGNATVDIFLGVHDTNRHFRVNEQTKELCVKHGDKVLLDDAKFLLGGNACNVSVGLQRLGLKTSLITEVGQDEFSQKITNDLYKEGVSCDQVVKSADEISSFSLILNYKKERTIFTESTEKDHNFSFNNLKADWIYLTSLNKKWMDAYEKTVDFAKKIGAKIVFNPGVAQIDAGQNHLSNILKSTEILIVNKKEAKRILDSEEEDIEIILKALKGLGSRMAVVTNGANGAWCIDENDNIYYQDAKKAEVVELTGAGDAFSSGFLGAIINGKNIKEAMLWGDRNSASVIEKFGSQPGLLTKDEIEH